MENGEIKVLKLLPNAYQDNTNGNIRGGKYGEQYVLNTLDKKILSDEGSYIFASNPTPGSGIAINIQTSFDATKPALLIKNTGNINSIYLDTVKLILSVVGGGTPTELMYAWVVDNIDRYTSGGTLLSAVSPNSNIQANNKAKVYFGAITATAASNDKRVVGQGHLRKTANVVGDTYLFTFDGKGTFEREAETVHRTEVPCPPIIVNGNNHSALLYLWNTGETTTAKTFLADIGWYER